MELERFAATSAVLETTEDGSPTIFLPEMDEHYHSTHGAIQEALHVYLRAGFCVFPENEVHVFEVGFGTGLNALLTLVEAEKLGKKVVYHAVERYPLPPSISDQLAYLPAYEAQFRALHAAAWNEEVAITPFFSLRKIECDLNEFTLDTHYDVIYFDAFGPDKQPDLWNETLFRQIFEHTKNGGVLTTYCAKGAVRRLFQSVGYTMERIPGPPGKREMLRGRRGE